MTKHGNTLTGAKDIKRWKVGHRMFFVQIQTLILALRKLEESPSGDRLNDISAILLGSGVMMQYSANFIGEKYDPVRDDMADIHPDFSGSFSADHANMIRCFPAIAKAGKLNPEEHEYFRECLEATYKAHSYVCKHFAGEDGSLAQENIVAWRDIATRLLSRALKKSGVEESNMPLKYKACKSAA